MILLWLTHCLNLQYSISTYWWAYRLSVYLTRAGFARQGAKEKQLLKEGNAFNVSPFVLRAMMSGQYWPEGDEVYHAELTVPILLVHGMYDKFVPMDEDQRMAEVSEEKCAQI